VIDNVNNLINTRDLRRKLHILVSSPPDQASQRFIQFHISVHYGLDLLPGRLQAVVRRIAQMDYIVPQVRTPDLSTSIPIVKEVGPKQGDIIAVIRLGVFNAKLLFYVRETLFVLIF